MGKYSEQLKAVLKNEHKESNITVRELSKKYGIPKSTIHGWVFGRYDKKEKQNFVKEYDSNNEIKLIKEYKLSRLEKYVLAIASGSNLNISDCDNIINIAKKLIDTIDKD